MGRRRGSPSIEIPSRRPRVLMQRDATGFPRRRLFDARCATRWRIGGDPAAINQLVDVFFFFRLVIDPSVQVDASGQDAPFCKNAERDFERTASANRSSSGARGRFRQLRSVAARHRDLHRSTSSTLARSSTAARMPASSRPNRTPWSHRLVKRRWSTGSAVAAGAVAGYRGRGGDVGTRPSDVCRRFGSSSPASARARRKQDLVLTVKRCAAKRGVRLKFVESSGRACRPSASATGDARQMAGEFGDRGSPVDAETLRYLE